MTTVENRPETATAAPSGRRRPPVAVLIGGGIVVILALIFGIKFLAYSFTHESTDDAKVDADTVTVTSKISEKVAKILVNTNQHVTKGQILVLLDDTDERTRLAIAQANYQAQVAQAQATESNVQLTQAQQNAQNKQSDGAILSSRASIANARANYASAQQQVKAAQAAIAQAQAQLRVAQANVPSAKEALVRADADLSRTAALVRTGDLAQQTLDAQRADQAQANAQYKAALDNVTAAETNVTQVQARYTQAVAAANAAQAGVGAQVGNLVTSRGRLAESDTPFRVSAVEAQATAADAQAKSLAAEVRQAKDQLSYTVIRSPIDGYVGAKNVEVGTTVAPGQSLLDIVPDTGLYITANFKETQLGKIKVGAPVEFSIDAYKGTTFKGTVVSIAPASQNTFSLVPAQNATGNFVKVTQRLAVRIGIDPKDIPADKPLRVGMSAVPSVDTK